MEARIVSSGSKALDMVKSRFERANDTFKLIFLDQYMPGLSGVETAYMISCYLTEVAPDLRHPYLVLMTNDATKSNRVKDERESSLLIV